MRKTIRLTIWLILIFAAHNGFSQTNKDIFLIGANGAIGQKTSLYSGGLGVNASYAFHLSPSFNMGAQLSVYDVFCNSSFGGFYPIPLRLQVMYFPYKLFENIQSKKLDNLKKVFLDGSIGHSFNSGDIGADLIFNSSNIGIGYISEISGGSAFAEISVNTFILDHHFSDEQRYHNELFTLTIGYAICKSK